MTAPAPTDVRSLLLELLAQSSRALATYHSGLRRSGAANDDLSTLAGFCDWAEAVLAEGRAALDAAELGNFVYCPSRAFSSESLASRIRARRALSMLPPRPRLDAPRRRPGGPH